MPYRKALGVRLMVLGLIPARSGSKGIPKKNIKPFCGRPLIKYAIDVGLKCKFIDMTVVSSDSDEILDVARKCDTKVGWINRPDYISQDDTPMIHVLRHAVERDEDVDAVVLIDPTNPLRTVEDMEGAWKLFNWEEDCGLVVSGCKAKYHPSFNLAYLDMSKYVKIWKPLIQESGCRQMCIPAYQLDTTVWIYSREAIEQGKRIPERTRLYLVPPERSASIDTQLDWEIAEYLYRRKQ